MIPRLKNFQPPADSFPYNPAKKVTVPANDSAEIILQGRGANAFGFNRILPFGSDLSVIEADFTLNTDYNILKDVQLSVVRQLFQRKSLLAPYIIQKNNDLVITLRNTSGADQDVNIQLIGYDTPAINKLTNEYKAQGLKMPTPIFLYGKGEIAADAKGQAIEIKTKSVDVDMLRMAVSTDNDDDISLSLQLFNESVKNKVFVQQINDEFEDGYSLVPIRVGRNDPFTLVVDNADAVNARTLSFIGEAYVYSNE